MYQPIHSVNQSGMGGALGTCTRLISAAHIYQLPDRKTVLMFHLLLAVPSQVRRMALDCLHHWVEEYCVDGFVVLNAEHLTQDQFGGILDNPPLPEEIATDPILR